MRLGMVTLLVGDYDEAIAYFTNKLGFVVLEDTVLSAEKRWVHVAPDVNGAGLLLAKATGPTQAGAIGNQTGGRVGFFLYTSDFDNDYERMTAAGVDFVETPREEEYGKVIVFRDLYGNKWDFIERPQRRDVARSS